MKVLCPSILALEAVVVLLAIPVLLSLTDVGPAGGWALAVLAVLALAVAGLFRRDPRRGVVAGWVVQALALASGLLVTAMVVVGLMFAGLWWLAVSLGGRVDRLQAERSAGPSA